jgi:glucose/arabinose dehydrogenase
VYRTAVHRTKVAHLVLAQLLFLFFASLLNIPLVFAQVNNQPAIGSQLMIADESPPAVSDPNLRIDRVATDLNRPTAMAFLGNSSDDIIVTEKDNGTVRRVIGGVIQPESLVDVAVANNNNTNERGLLGMAVAKQLALSKLSDNPLNVV